MRPRLLLLGLLLILASITLVFAEFWLRSSYLGEATESRDHAEETPYLPARLKANYQGTMWGIPFKTNRHGFRDEEDFDYKPDTQEVRVLSLGDSIGFGLGIPAAEHYGKVLERGLDGGDERDRFRVINAAGQGFSPSGYSVYLRREGLRFEPSLVIAEIELCNDVSDEAFLYWESSEDQPNQPTAVRGGRYVVGWDGNLLGTCSMGPYAFEKTYTYTVLLRRVLNLLYRIDPTEPFHSTVGVTYYLLGFERYLLDQQRIEAGWKRLFGAVEGIHEVLAKQDIPFLLLILPSRFVFEKHAPQHARFARGLVQRTLEWAKSHQIPHLDCTDVLGQGGGERLYFDFAHLTAEGNRVLGQALHGEVVRRFPDLGRSGGEH